MKSVGQLLAESPFFAGVDADLVAELAGCAQNVHVAQDAYLFHAGGPADRLYVVRRGRVALEIPGSTGGPEVVDTVDDGDVVGWAWLVPPYRWFTDARAVLPTSAVALDAVCLRAACDADPRLGYALLQRVAGVLYRRMQGARVRLLDLYGAPR